MKKPLWKKWWFWVIIVVVLAGTGSALRGSNSGEQSARLQSPSERITVSPKVSSQPVEPTTTPDPTPKIPMGQKNALSKAEDYLSIMAFSHSGLIKQLEFEGFTNEEATYAADNCGADWNEQAAIKAQSYLDMTSFSRSGLIEQLVYEGFTSAQAEYGVTAVGY